MLFPKCLHLNLRRWESFGPSLAGYDPGIPYPLPSNLTMIRIFLLVPLTYFLILIFATWKGRFTLKSIADSPFYLCVFPFSLRQSRSACFLSLCLCLSVCLSLSVSLQHTHTYPYCCTFSLNFRPLSYFLHMNRYI